MSGRTGTRGRGRALTVGHPHFRKAPVEILILLVVAAAVIGFIYSNRNKKVQSEQLADELADARRWTERLGGQVLALDGDGPASRQAMADASERFTAASSQLDQASTVRQARLARDSALEGLYYVRAARLAMGVEAGPPLPGLDGQDIAGAVSETREVQFEGRTVAASPTASTLTPNYHPGGRVVGRPVPAGWYSEPWWRPALVAGAWGVGSMMLFSTMFSGMTGVGYDAQAFEEGDGDGAHDDFGGHDDGGDGGIGDGMDFGDFGF